MNDNQQTQATVITSLNLKGGVGKTHLCWLIAGVCQERLKRCLVLDLDKRGNISTTLLGDDAPNIIGCEAFFDNRIDPVISELIQRSKLRGIDCIPGSFHLERCQCDFHSSERRPSRACDLGEIGVRILGEGHRFPNGTVAYIQRKKANVTSELQKLTGNFWPF